MVLRCSVRRHESTLYRVPQSRMLRKYLRRAYTLVITWIWNHLPAPLRYLPFVRNYGCHLQSLIQLRALRTQSTGTFFFRNRPELELLLRLLKQNQAGSTVEMAILGCSKGAEVYSCSYAIRSARPDLNVRICAMDISKDTLEFAEKGTYCLGEQTEPCSDHTFHSIFERMSSEEMEALFEREEGRAWVRSRFRAGITWRLGDAGDPNLVAALGLQDIVVANRFLCHMPPAQAEACLRNLARLVKGGGYVFVSGVDLAVRSKVARELGWRPVTELIQEVHEGDPSLRRDWPLQYWGLEPLNRGRDDWEIRYASVFQLAAPVPSGDVASTHSHFGQRVASAGAFDA